MKIKINHYSLGQTAQWVGELSCAPKGDRFDSQSEHRLIPSRLQVQSSVGAPLGGNRSMFSLILKFLSLFLNRSSDEH